MLTVDWVWVYRRLSEVYPVFDWFGKTTTLIDNASFSATVTRLVNVDWRYSLEEGWIRFRKYSAISSEHGLPLKIPLQMIFIPNL